MGKEKAISGGMYISKKESVMLQGIAVSLMVWHHLFGFPERIGVPYVLVFDSLFHIETIAAYFGRICIAIFAFCSGYGMEKKAIGVGNTGIRGIPANYRDVLRHLYKFYSRYWLVFAAFVPLGFAINRYPVQIETVIRAFFGYSYVYNAEWWYIGYYVGFMLLFPLVFALWEWLGKGHPALLHAGMVFCFMGVSVIPEGMPGQSFLSVFLYFVEGMYVVRAGWFEQIADRLQKPWLRVCTGTVLVMAVFVMRTLGTADHWLVPLFVFGLVLLLKNRWISKCFGPVFLVTGKYSTYIWLTHTFFAYYYFQTFTYFPKYSWLIAGWCMLLCLFSGSVLEKIRTAFCAGSGSRETNVKHHLPR